MKHPLYKMPLGVCLSLWIGVQSGCTPPNQEVQTLQAEIKDLRKELQQSVRQQITIVDQQKNHCMELNRTLLKTNQELTSKLASTTQDFQALFLKTLAHSPPIRPLEPTNSKKSPHPSVPTSRPSSK